MRKYTFLVSLVAHVGVVIAIVLTTLVVTHTLPGVPPMFEFVLVRAEMPPPPEPLEPRPLQPAPAPIVAIPIDAPASVLPEPAVPRVVDDAPLTGAAFGDGAPGVSGGTRDGIIGEAPWPPPPPKPAVLPRVGGAIVAPTKVHHVTPLYPPLALAARKEGVVILEAVIAEDGAVRDLRVLKSISLLDQAAIDAVRQWRFTPTTLNGQPTAVIMTVSVVFNLSR